MTCHFAAPATLIKTWRSTKRSWGEVRYVGGFIVHRSSRTVNSCNCYNISYWATHSSGVWRQLSQYWKKTKSIHVLGLADLLIWIIVRTFHDDVRSPLYRSHKQTPTKTINVYMSGNVLIQVQLIRIPPKFEYMTIKPTTYLYLITLCKFGTILLQTTVYAPFPVLLHYAVFSTPAFNFRLL